MTALLKEKFSYYEFEICEFPDDDYPSTKYYYYKIYTDDPDYKFYNRTDVLRESDEYFDTVNEAKLAAIGHISLLENGEG